MSALEDQSDVLEEEEDEDEEEDQEEAAPARGADSEASLEDLLAKREQASNDKDESDEDSMLTMDREERVGTLPAKVAPKQATEFVCKSCFLVKHRSQLADKRRTLCKDCA